MPISSGSQPATAKPRKRPRGFRPFCSRVLLVDHHAGAAAVGELAGVAGRDQAAGNGRADAADAFLGGAGADAFVVLDRDFLGAQAHHRVGHAGQHGDRCDLVLEAAGFQRGGGLLLAGCAVLVHGVAADVVALGDLLGRLQHVPVDLGLVLHEPGVGQHVLVGFVLHARDALDAAGHVHLAFARDDALRGGGDGLQARGAEAVDRHARGGDRQPARSAIWRAMLEPVAPSGVAQPMMTSSTSAGSMPAR
jgi:hypothetical protein